MSAESKVRTIHDFHAESAAGKKLVVLTAYDALFARLLALFAVLLALGARRIAVGGGGKRGRRYGTGQ